MARWFRSLIPCSFGYLCASHDNSRRLSVVWLSFCSCLVPRLLALRTFLLLGEGWDTDVGWAVYRHSALWPVVSFCVNQHAGQFFQTLTRLFPMQPSNPAEHGGTQYNLSTLEGWDKRNTISKLHMLQQRDPTSKLIKRDRKGLKSFLFASAPWHMFLDRPDSYFFFF